MSLQFVGLKEINGPLVVLDHVQGASFEEMVSLELEDGTSRDGRIVSLEGEKAVIQVFEGTTGLSLTNTRTRLLGHPMEMALSPEVLGRVFSGSGKPIDGLGEVFAEVHRDINGQPINPVSRTYPRNYIRTGISSIDALMTLIRGQKLPIFSGSGMNHNKLAVPIVSQAQLTKDGKALYMHCLPADITGLSCVEGEVDNSVFDRYIEPLYKEASFKPYIIAAMIFLSKVKDPVAALRDLEKRGEKRKEF